MALDTTLGDLALKFNVTLEVRTLILPLVPWIYNVLVSCITQ
jgi:hypothetical protein